MFPENIPAGAYTHLNYAFAFVDPVSFAIAPMSELDKDLWPRFTGLKEVNPGLKTFISVGGWSMNDPDQPTAATFSNLAASSDAQNKFFKSLITFMATYGFDGVDIDWEYPVATERSGREADYDNYVTFLKNLKAAFAASGHAYGLTITVPSSYWYLRHFDIVEINKVIDWFNVMTYDLHGTWDSTIDSLGPKVMAHTNLTEIDMTMDLMWRNNVSTPRSREFLRLLHRRYRQKMLYSDWDSTVAVSRCPTRVARLQDVRSTVAVLRVSALTASAHSPL